MQSSMTSFAQLRLERMSRSFGHHHALKEISLNVEKGEFIALLGPSGCGKSTALNCIAGLLATTGGGIYLDARRIDQLKPEDRGFGMVFQNYALFPHMSVGQNIGFGLKMRGLPKSEIERRVEEAIAMVRLEGQGHKLPGQLSGGQQQRVAIARAIIIEPALVLMDEPLSNLDAKLRLEMRVEIRRIHNQLGATTIYVTHDQDEALSLADRIVVLKDGEIRQVGIPSALYEQPDHLDVAEFMGYRNRLSGEVVAVEGERVVLAVGASLLQGQVRHKIKKGEKGILVARPDDVTVVGKSAERQDAHLIEATVETIEYRGREFVGTARMHHDNDTELVFHAPSHVAPGHSVSLNIDASRALLFAGDRT